MFAVAVRNHSFIIDRIPRSTTRRCGIIVIIVIDRRYSRHHRSRDYRHRIRSYNTFSGTSKTSPKTLKAKTNPRRRNPPNAGVVRVQARQDDTVAEHGVAVAFFFGWSVAEGPRM